MSYKNIGSIFVPDKGVLSKMRNALILFQLTSSQIISIQKLESPLNNREAFLLYSNKEFEVRWIF
jgi:hypothetical protein